MKMVLEEKDLWGIVSGEELQPDNEGITEAHRYKDLENVEERPSPLFVYLWEMSNYH